MVPFKTIETYPQSRYFVPPPPLASIQNFSDLYFESNRAANPCFTSFEQAIHYGKNLANIMGFQLRIKTTGVNSREGIVYKYVCCQRQGLAEHGWKPKDGVRLRQRDSVRCDCKWNCKLLGIKVDHEPISNTEPAPPTPRDTDGDLLWIWRQSDDDKEYEHNHIMDLSFKVYSGTVRESRKAFLASPKTSLASPKTSLVTPPLSGARMVSRRSSQVHLKSGLPSASRRSSVQDCPMAILALMAEESTAHFPSTHFSYVLNERQSLAVGNDGSSNSESTTTSSLPTPLSMLDHTTKPSSKQLNYPLRYTDPAPFSGSAKEGSVPQSFAPQSFAPVSFTPVPFASMSTAPAKEVHSTIPFLAPIPAEADIKSRKSKFVLEPSLQMEVKLDKAGRVVYKWLPAKHTSLTTNQRRSQGMSSAVFAQVQPKSSLTATNHVSALLNL